MATRKSPRLDRDLVDDRDEARSWMSPRRRLSSMMVATCVAAAAHGLSGCALFMPSSSEAPPPSLVTPQFDPEPMAPTPAVPRPPRPKPLPLAALASPAKPVTSTHAPDVVTMLPPLQVPGQSDVMEAVTGKAPPAAAPEIVAERILGLDAGALHRSLGSPQARLDFPPARVWRYATATCTFDVYFYMDVKSREFRVLHYEATAHDGSERQKDQCYNRVLAEQHGSARGSGLVEAAGSVD